MVDELHEMFTQNSSSQEIMEYIEWFSWDDYKKYLTFDETHYSRNYVYKSDLFEVLIIWWLPGQKTPIHGHPINWCYVKILSGNIEETLYDKQSWKSFKKHLAEQGNILYNHDDLGLHTLENMSEYECVSLHIYSPWNYNPISHNRG